MTPINLLAWRFIRLKRRILRVVMSCLLFISAVIVLLHLALDNIGKAVLSLRVSEKLYLEIVDDLTQRMTEQRRLLSLIKAHQVEQCIGTQVVEQLQQQDFFFGG